MYSLWAASPATWTFVFHNTGWNSPIVPPVQALEGVIKLGFRQFLKPLFSLSIHLLVTVELPSLIAGIL